MRERNMSLHGRCILWNGIAFLGVGLFAALPGHARRAKFPMSAFAKFLASAAAELPAGLSFNSCHP